LTWSIRQQLKDIQDRLQAIDSSRLSKTNYWVIASIPCEQCLDLISTLRVCSPEINATAGALGGCIADFLQPAPDGFGAIVKPFSAQARTNWSRTWLRIILCN
jgi:hypothetical protein